MEVFVFFALMALIAECPTRHDFGKVGSLTSSRRLVSGTRLPTVFKQAGSVG